MNDDAMGTPLISCIIVNWNTRELLLQCIESIEAWFASVTYEVIVVDNASSDGSVDAVHKTHPGVVVVENKRNGGFAAGVNQGLVMGKGEYFLVLNPDIIITDGSVSKLVAVFRENPEVGMVSPRLVNLDGSIQAGYVLKYPSIMQLVLFYTVLTRWSKRSQMLTSRYFEADLGLTMGSVLVDQLPGACMLVRRAAVEEVGMMDEQFQLFFEDVDWCFRMRQKGWRLLLCPDIAWKHIGGQSVRPGENYWVSGRFQMSLLFFFDKHGNIVQRVVSKFVLLSNSILILLARKLSFAVISGDSVRAARFSIDRQRFFLQEFRKKYVLTNMEFHHGDSKRNHS